MEDKIKTIIDRAAGENGKENDQLLFAAALASEFVNDGNLNSKDGKTLNNIGANVLDKLGIKYDTEKATVSFYDHANGNEEITISVDDLKDGRSSLMNAMDDNFKDVYDKYSKDLVGASEQAELAAVALKYALDNGKAGNISNDEKGALKYMDRQLGDVEVSFSENKGPNRSLEDNGGGINIGAGKAVESVDITSGSNTYSLPENPNPQPSKGR